MPRHPRAGCRTTSSDGDKSAQQRGMGELSSTESVQFAGSVRSISQISILIAEALHGAVWKDFRFFASLDHLRKTLIGSGVIEPEAQAVVDSLIDVGFEVRTQRGL